MSTKMCGIGALFHQKNLRKSGYNSRGSSSSSSNSALGSDWLQRASSSSWENLSQSSSEIDLSGELAPVDVPEGSLALYVGSNEQQRRRFVVGTWLVNNPLFKPLLDKAAEEYGYDHAGALTIPCDALVFEHVMWLLDNNDPASAHLEISQLLG